MKRSTLQWVLVLSLLLNLGVIGAVGYRVMQQGQLPELSVTTPRTPACPLTSS